MPTLFTALQSHADREKTEKTRGVRGKVEFPLGETVAAGEAKYVRAIEAAPTKRKRRSTDPHPLLSIKDRFKVIGKPEPSRHIIVVGAGFAGLSAAYELQSLGYQVTVLEAQKEVGGRVLTKHGIVPGQVMEAGAELIGLNHLAWWSYKDKFGLRFRRLPEPTNPPVILGGRRLSPTEAAQLGREMDRVRSLISKIARRVDPDQPWKTRDAKALDSISLRSGLELISMSSKCQLAFLEQLQTDNGVAAGRQSWLGNLAMIKGGGLDKFWTDTETHHCKGGNQQLAFHFKAKLKNLKLGEQVKEIRLSSGAVTVTTKSGKSLTGSDVILAIPPTLWREIRFSPALPAAYKVQFGRNVKYLLNIERDCCRPNDPSMSSDGPIDLTWKGTDGQGAPRVGLVAFSGAADADTCARWRDRKKQYLRELARVYPKIGACSRYGVFIDWPRKRWTRGSYSFPRPGEVTRVGPLLRSGFKGQIHFAGEHTCYAFTGYMEAALQSGLRVAEQIARRDGIIGKALD